MTESETLTDARVAEALKAKLGEDFLALRGAGEDAAAVLKPAAVRPALELLKNELGFNMLVDHTAADLSKWSDDAWQGVFDPCQATEGKLRPDGAAKHERFELTWRLMKLDARSGLILGRFAVKCRVDEGAAAPASSRDLWPAADWLEREVWDMFGVKPSDRPDIKRLLLYEEFRGHALRKDYPIAKRQPLVAPRIRPEDRPIAPGDLRPRLTEHGQKK